MDDYLKLYEEIYDLMEFKPWAGAIYNYKRIIEAGLGQAFIYYLAEIYPEGLNATMLNDILWFDDEFIDEFLGIEDEVPFEEEE